MKQHKMLSVLLAVGVLILMGASCSRLMNIKASIAGTVYMDGRPVAFGTVQAINEGGTVVGSERTTDSGHYIIKNLDPGTYTLVYLNSNGVQFGRETTVQVRRGRFETVNLEISMEDRVNLGGN
jgi:hypothetical protein